MADRFSGALRVADLNDFIAPSQACVVSLKGHPQPGGAPKLDLSDEVQIQAKSPSSFLQAKPVENGEAVKVTLHDCLACRFVPNRSGCITSAETIMLEQQSTDEFVSKIQAGDKAVIVSLSPQTRASLAVYYGVTALQAFRKLTTYLKSLGVRAVFDTSCSRDLVLLEASEEFVARYRDSHPPEEVEDCKPSTSGRSGRLPMLASACPGWICYAEKTHGSYILPYISSAKSPQQAMGTILKRHMCYTLGLRPEQVYHVTVMPCYDKKLEASRDDFVFAVDHASGNCSETDCVLTSGKMLELLESFHTSRPHQFKVASNKQSADVAEAGCGFQAAGGVTTGQIARRPTLTNVALDVGITVRVTNVDEDGHLYGAQGGSGGYAESIFRYAAKVLFGRRVAEPVEFRTIRNVDFKEVSLEVDGKTVLRFAIANGFRNIQTLVRKLKSGRCEYDFVEVMACPGGCLNGGGQIKPRKGQSAKNVLQQLETAYLQEVDVKDPAENRVVQSLYASWLGHPFSPRARELMHTQYHRRDKSVTSQISNW
eukprot:SM000085S23217  [mRNA]  locus=s85:102393:106718:- [translate_table: standard]